MSLPLYTVDDSFSENQTLPGLEASFSSSSPSSFWSQSDLCGSDLDSNRGPRSVAVYQPKDVYMTPEPLSFEHGSFDYSPSASSRLASPPRTPTLVHPHMGSYESPYYVDPTATVKQAPVARNPVRRSFDCFSFDGGMADLSTELNVRCAEPRPLRAADSDSDLSRAPAPRRRTARPSVDRRKTLDGRAAAPRRAAHDRSSNSATIDESEFDVNWGDKTPKPCVCAVAGCGARFQRPEHLTRHRKSAKHNTSNPYVCELEHCVDKKGNRKAFNRQDNKTAHIVKTHLTPALADKGRRDRVSPALAIALGWEKYFEAAAKEKSKLKRTLRERGQEVAFRNR